LFNWGGACSFFRRGEKKKVFYGVFFHYEKKNFFFEKNFMAFMGL